MFFFGRDDLFCPSVVVIVHVNSSRMVCKFLKEDLGSFGVVLFFVSYTVVVVFGWAFIWSFIF